MGAEGPPAAPGDLAEEAERLVAFAEAATEGPGFGWLDEHGRIDPTGPRELWVTCRMTHVHALAHLWGRPGSARHVDHGLRALAGGLRDAEHGGWWPRLGAGTSAGTGQGGKDAYGHAFVVLAGASATVAGRPGGRALLDEALAVLLDRFWDDEAGMVVEEWDAAWRTLDPYRGVNANMHAVEALMAAAAALEDDTLLDRALRITERVVRDVAPAHAWRVPEHFDEQWRPVLDYHAEQPAHPFRPYGATVGHWLEWSRLCLQLRSALGERAPAWLHDHAVELFAAAVRDGWAVDGAEGFVYTVDFDGTPVVRQRMHWVLAEALAAAATLHRVTGEPVYAQHAARWWAYARRYVVDVEHGSWHHELAADNTPAATTWSGKPDVYHAVGAVLAPRLPVGPSAATAIRDGLLAPG